MSRPLVSVVTPVYNGERHLAECLDSVLAQRYPHWDHVVVDNASSDGSAAIARRYAAKDPRIRVVPRAEHLDVIGSHNAAFREISPLSRYCKVLQADDWLFPDCLAEMVDLAQAHPNVGIVGAYRLDGDWVDLDGIPWTSPVVPGRLMGRLGLLGGPYVFGAPTATLIRSDIVRARDPFYDPACLHADEAACYDVLQRADFGFVHQVLTYRRRHDEDATMSSFARRMNTYLPGNLWILQRYGPVFLEPHEYRRRLSERLAEYDAFLADALLSRRDPEFWTYHRGALAALGRSLSWRRLALSALRRAWRLPVRAARHLRARRITRASGRDDTVQARVADARWHAAAKSAEIERAAPLVAAMLARPALHGGRASATGRRTG